MKKLYSALCLALAFVNLHAESCQPKSLLELPEPLFSLGQNIINKNEIFIGPVFYANYWAQDESLNFMPTALYGVTDTFTLTCFLPTFFTIENGGKSGSGCGDIIPGFEWAFIHQKNNDALTQATIFAQIKIPVSKREPILTSGAVDFIVGSTLAYNNESSYMFISGGAQCPTWHKNHRKGYQFYYEAGIGPILHKTDNSIFSIFVEVDGIYTTSDIDNPYPSDVMLKNNALFAGPVLYWGYKSMIVQVGAQGVIADTFNQPSDERKSRIGMQFFLVF